MTVEGCGTKSDWTIGFQIAREPYLRVTVRTRERPFLAFFGQSGVVEDHGIMLAQLGRMFRLPVFSEVLRRSANHHAIRREAADNQVRNRSGGVPNREIVSF